MMRKTAMMMGALLLVFVIVSLGSVSALSADLNLSKNATPGTYHVGENVTWTVQLTNNGPDNATLILVYDDIVGLINGTILSATADKGTLVGTDWNISSLNQSETATATIVTNFSSPGLKVNNVTVSAEEGDSNPANNMATASVTILPPPEIPMADLNISKTESPGTANISDPVTWTITVSNKGPNAAPNVTVIDDTTGLTNATIVSANPSPPSGTMWNLGTLPPENTTTITIVTNFSSTGVKTNKVSVTSDLSDPNPADNNATASVTIGQVPPGQQADLSISKAVVSHGPFDIGDEVTWKVNLTNNGPASATNISIVEDTTKLVNATKISVTVSSGSYANNTWNLSALTNGTTATLTMVTAFNSTGTKTNTVTITTLDQVDPTPSDNSATRSITIGVPGPTERPTLVIRPKTLNLKSKGVFTVFVTLAGLSDLSKVDLATSSLTCSGAGATKFMISDEGGGTLIAKFHRQDLENVTAGPGVTISCSGVISVNGQTIQVEGSDTIRVIGVMKDMDSLLSDFRGAFKKARSQDKSIGNGKSQGNADHQGTVAQQTTPSDAKNPGQVKKELVTTDDGSGSNKNGDQNSGAAGHGKPQKENPGLAKGHDKNN